MSFNVKHYLAIGLGVAVFAGFAMQRSGPPKPVAFDSQSAEFKPLASFESAPVAEGVAANETTTQQAAELEPFSTESFGNEAQPLTFNSADEDNDFSIPQFVDNSELAVSDLADDSGGEMIDSEDGFEESPSAFVAVEPVPESAQSEVAHSEQPNTRWKVNPFAQTASSDKVLATDQTEPALAADDDELFEDELPISLASDVDTEFESTIIVEPTLDGTFQEATVKTVSDEQSYESIMVDDSDTEFAVELPSGEPTVAAQTGPTTDPNLETSLTRTLEVAPWQLKLTESVAQQAAHHIEYGKSLSRRGATFAARQEFYSALRIIAQANDAATGSNVFSQALSKAVLAMKEAGDFVFSDVEAEMVLNVATITETHLSRIISEEEAKSMSSAQAMERYFEFAQQKLDEASGRNVVSAEALYCLGKLHSVVAKTSTVPNRFDVAKAMAFHQAALTCDANNYRSANELGVLLVRIGQLEKATELFKQSLITQPTPSTWQNLAKTHRRMGQPILARLADSEFKALAQSQTTNATSTIRWVPSKTFNEKAPMELYDKQRIAARPEKATPVAETKSAKEPSKLKSFGERLKKLF